MTSSETTYQEEVDGIQLEQWLSARLDGSITNFDQHQENGRNRSSVMLPYYCGLSEKLQRCPRDHKIKLFFKPMRTIGDKLRNGKGPVHPYDRQGAVYFVPCGACDQMYFDETKRSFNARKKEHINYIKHFHPDKSALAKHVLELEHRMNWSKTQIAAFENDFRKDVSLNNSLLILHPTPLTKRVHIFFQKSVK